MIPGINTRVSHGGYGWLGASVLCLGTLSLSRATAQDYERVLLDNNGGTAIVPSSGKSVPETIIPIPFPAPEPIAHRVDTTTSGFRALNVINVELQKKGAALITERFAIGSSQPSAGKKPDIPAATIFAGLVSTRLPAAQANTIGPIDPLRPVDKTPKAQAVIIAGIHGREWMAIESVLRKFEVFNEDAMATDLSGLEPGAKPSDPPIPTLRSRDAYFAENVVMRFAPVINPGGLQHTMRVKPLEHWKRCQWLKVPPPFATGEGLSAGNLRDGRMARKNLKFNDAFMGTGSATDADALDGVDVGRNLLRDSSGSVDTPNDGYRGWPLGATPIASPETAAVYSLLDGVFGQRGSAQSFFPSAKAPRAETGAVILDVHTPLDTATFSTIGVQPNPGRPDRWASLANAIVRVGVGKSDGTTKGTVEHLGREVYGVPAATLELRPDERMDLYGPTGPLVRGAEHLDLNFLSGDDPVFFSRVFTNAKRSIDNALDWSSGPPYVRRVILAKTKDPGATYDSSKTGSDTEVFYDVSWEASSPADATRRVRVNNLAKWPGERWLSGSGSGSLATVEVTLLIGFNKPMRDAGDPLGRAPFPVELATLDGLGIASLDTSVATVWSWQGSRVLTEDRTSTPPVLQLGALRYVNDTWIAQLAIPVGAKAAGWGIRAGGMRIGAVDLVGFKVDGDPRTVPFIGLGTFTDYEDSRIHPTTSDNGGIDDGHGPFQVDTVRPRLRSFP